MKIQEVQDIIQQLHALEQSLGPEIFKDMERKVEESVENHARKYQEKQSSGWLWYFFFGLIVASLKTRSWSSESWRTKE
jgi:hypothetical protein